MVSRRKKWTEAEERTLIDKYADMISDGTLAKMKTREKKFKPIASYVNSLHHVQDPIGYPWQWCWKDVSTKVQNMRHQYLLVKQKIKKQEPDCNSSTGGGENNGEEFDWMEGLTHWSNFLRYKDVFGDVGLVTNNGNDLVMGTNGDGDHGGGFDVISGAMEIVEFGQMGHSRNGDFGVEIDGVENGVLGLGFECDGEEAEKNYIGNCSVRENGDNCFFYEDVEPNGSISKKKIKKKKKKKVMKGLGKKAWGFLGNQLGKLREMEAHFEQRELERDRERQRRDSHSMEHDREWARKWEEKEKIKEERNKSREKFRVRMIQEWEAMEKENEERERRRREDELMYEKEWEERVNRRQLEWKKRLDEMLSQHRVEMGQMQTRILHEQQNLTSQLLGIVSHWTSPHPAGLSDHTNHTSASNHYLSQMMQNLHHVNSLVHDDARVEGENQDDQFIVDG